MTNFARAGALEQRAGLLDAVWADLCGSREAVRRLHLPPSTLPIGQLTHATLDSLAVDLIYCPDGAWRVARDRVGGHPGAAWLGAPLLAAFLPALCRCLLGEPLR